MWREVSSWPDCDSTEQPALRNSGLQMHSMPSFTQAPPKKQWARATTADQWQHHSGVTKWPSRATPTVGDWMRWRCPSSWHTVQLPGHGYGAEAASKCISPSEHSLSAYFVLSPGSGDTKMSKPLLLCPRGAHPHPGQEPETRSALQTAYCKKSNNCMRQLLRKIMSQTLLIPCGLETF